MRLQILLSSIVIAWRVSLDPQTASASPTHSSITELSKLTNLAKAYSETIHRLEQWAKISPLFNGLIQEASKKSAKIRILAKLGEGHLPDFHDLLNLATSGHDNISVDVVNTMHTNTQFQQWIALMSDKDFGNSKADLEKAVYLFTGKTIDLRTSLIGTKYSVTDNGKYHNLIEFMRFIGDNWTRFLSCTEHSKKGYLPYIHCYREADFTHLRTLDVSSLNLDNSKYSVSAHNTRQELKTDVSNIVQMYNEIPSILAHQDTTKAKTLDSSMKMALLKLNTDVVEDTFGKTSESGKLGKSSRPGAVVG